MSIPTWLSRHGGSLRIGPDGRSRAVLIDDKPEYVLQAVPAAGRYACKVMASVNGKRLESGATYPSAEEALKGGLEDLRKVLGW